MRNGRADDMSAPVITLVGGPTALIEAGWAHFTRNAEVLAESLTAPGTGPRPKILERGVPTRIDPR
jgi:hypothetical protein